MASSDPLRILVGHDRWATGQMIGACEKLSEEQFHQRFAMGPGSLHDTVVHILGAMRTWTHTLRGEPLGVRIDNGTRRGIVEIRELHQAVTSEFAAAVFAHPVEEEVSREREGKVFVFTRGVVVTHVATHGMHHRAQCLNMLRQVGAEKMPLSSVVEWVRSGEPA